ncbi:MAG: 2-oxoacid:acceptor oxidoreductase family protein [Candidatus Adiutrix sp.]|jgi:2-oxoglutarate ferredoxin oxidoreductase subunit gamma|nr:2-oxoacid:acceptor oxidoreductase family protein [Candidatus Adiutrix sp.]
MMHEMIFAGFGGQGIMLMGQLLAQAGLEEGRHVSWIPSYGPEMRGGAANCSVVISDEVIGAPVVQKPQLALAMNLQSKERFEDMVAPGGRFIINGSLVPDPPRRSDIRNYVLPLSDLAVDELKSAKVLNMIALGAVFEATGAVSEESIHKAMDFMFGKKLARRPDLAALNRKAFQAGREALNKAARA